MSLKAHASPTCLLYLAKSLCALIFELGVEGVAVSDGGDVVTVPPEVAGGHTETLMDNQYLTHPILPSCRRCC